MSILKSFSTKTPGLRPEIFWRWVIVSFACIFLAIAGFSFLFFRATQSALEAPIVVDKKNTEQQVTRVEARIQKIETVVQNRTGVPALAPTSQN